MIDYTRVVVVEIEKSKWIQIMLRWWIQQLLVLPRCEGKGKERVSKG